MAHDRIEEIRTLAGQGLSRRQIASRLGISPTRVQQLLGASRLQVRLKVNARTVSLSSRDASPAELAERIRRALALAKVDIVEQ